MLSRSKDHMWRLLRHFGARTRLGPKDYFVRGYLSNTIDLDGAHEDELDFTLASLLERPGCFIDVGVNLGQTLGKVLSLDPHRNYLGFEPQVVACSMVSTFLAENSLRQCHVLPIGLSNENGTKEFYSSGPADTMASLIEGREGALRSLVPVRIGDEVLAEIGVKQVCGIKIDVEGAELEVLLGFARTLKEIRPPVLFEVLPNFAGSDRRPVAAHLADERRLRAQTIFDYLSQSHYQVAQIMPDGSEMHIERFSLDKPDEYAGSNYVGRPAGDEAGRG